MTGVPYTFSTQTSTIPLAELDANFNTPVTIGTTTVGLGNTVTSLSNLAGINFGGGTFANYENTAWTPTDASGAGLSFTGVSANYTRIGNIVWCYASLTYPSNADSTNAKVGGLPVTVANHNYAGTINMIYVSTDPAAATFFQPIENDTSGNIFQANSGQLTNVQLSGASVNLSFWYPVT